jgi:antibiotic biosynthesis monooxygenase (ABM) superfamily enzyme
MIERHVYIRLKPEHKHERVAMAEYAQRTLAQIPGVIRVCSGLPADEHSDKAWDFSLRLCFASLQDVEAYRVHPDHRRYVDEDLAPRMQVIKAWNFTLQEA